MLKPIRYIEPLKRLTDGRSVNFARKIIERRRLKILFGYSGGELVFASAGYSRNKAVEEALRALGNAVGMIFRYAGTARASGLRCAAVILKGIGITFKSCVFSTFSSAAVKTYNEIVNAICREETDNLSVKYYSERVGRYLSEIIGTTAFYGNVPKDIGRIVRERTLVKNPLGRTLFEISGLSRTAGKNRSFTERRILECGLLGAVGILLPRIGLNVGLKNILELSSEAKTVELTKSLSFGLAGASALFSERLRDRLRDSFGYELIGLINSEDARERLRTENRIRRKAVKGYFMSGLTQYEAGIAAERLIERIGGAARREADAELSAERFLEKLKRDPEFGKYFSLYMTEDRFLRKTEELLLDYLTESPDLDLNVLKTLREFSKQKTDKQSEKIFRGVRGIIFAAAENGNEKHAWENRFHRLDRLMAADRTAFDRRFSEKRIHISHHEKFDKIPLKTALVSPKLRISFNSEPAGRFIRALSHGNELNGAENYFELLGGGNVSVNFAYSIQKSGENFSGVSRQIESLKSSLNRLSSEISDLQVRHKEIKENFLKKSEKQQLEKEILKNIEQDILLAGKRHGVY